MSKVPSDPGNEPARDPGMMSLQAEEQSLTHEVPIFPSQRYKALSAKHLDEIPQLERLSRDDRFAMKVVASVLPFRSNRYVIDSLIDWDRVPDDPVYQITFPQQDMLEEVDFLRMADLMRRDASAGEIKEGAHEIREKLNPHPAGQRELNIPQVAHETIHGLQHKYRETVLFFPSQGQTCHAYCTFCFRWAQFVGDNELKIVAKEADGLHDYLATHPDVTDLLVTGGDPMIMKTAVFANYLEPLVDDPRFAHVQDIRIGTKALTFWPYRFVGDEDADDMLRLLEKIVKAGKHVAIMAHFNHWRELETKVVREAIRRLRDAGAVIRCQAPLLRHINDSSDVWIRMWEEEVRLGMIPYYMFVERDTGARNYFEVPLEQACDIFRNAYKHVSGLARTVRGPSMSATPGKVEIQDVQQLAGEKVFILRFLQGRNPDWVSRPFYAAYDPEATWFDQLRPAFGQEKFFFTDDFNAMVEGRWPVTKH